MGEQEKVTPAGQALVLGIYLNSGSDPKKALRHVTLKESLNDKTLAEVRSLLSKDKQLTSAQARYPFCSGDGGSVPESTKFSVYSSMLKGNGETPKESEDGEGNDSGSVVENPKIILKKETIWTGVDERTEKILGEKLNLDYTENKAALIEAPLKRLSSSFTPTDYAAAVSKVTAVHPADMTEQNWDAVMRTNSVLSGQWISTLATDTRQITTIERGVYTAFELKSRDFEPYQVSYTTLEKIGGTQSLKIPRFRVVDDSSVDVFETKTSVATALAKSSFSQTVVEASAGGGAFGISAAVKAGYKESKDKAKASSNSNDTSVMNISFNFPRVVLHLDPENLELSKECRDCLEQVKNSDDVNGFNKRFGTLFARRVELGGRLFSDQETTEISGSSVSQKAKSMKASASLSISSSFAHGSVSGSHEKQSNKQKSEQTSNYENTITWAAQGGDTLLCNNPAAWCPTVASFYNWRVMKQDDVCSLIEMIGMMKGYSWVPRQFAQAAKVKKRLQFRLNAKVKHGTKVKGCLGLAMPEKRETVYVGYVNSNPEQRQIGHSINRLLELNPLCRLKPPAEDGDYFEVRNMNFEEVQESRLEYNKPYRMYNPYYKSWLAATESFRPHTAQRFLYGGNIEDAGLFFLETPGINKKSGRIENDHEVQLILLNEEKEEQGIAMLLDFDDWNDYVGVHNYTDNNYRYIVYTQMEYGP